MLLFLLLGAAHATTVTVTKGYYTDDKCTILVQDGDNICENIGCETTSFDGEIENECVVEDMDDIMSSVLSRSECTCVDNSDCEIEVTNVYANEGDLMLACGITNFGMQMLNSGLDDEGRRRVQEALRRRTEENTIEDICVDLGSYFIGMKVDGCDEVDHTGFMGLLDSLQDVEPGTFTENTGFQPTDLDAETMSVTLDTFTDDKCTESKETEGEGTHVVGEGCNEIGIIYDDVFIGFGAASMKFERDCDEDTLTMTQYEDCGDCSCEGEVVLDKSARGSCTAEEDYFGIFSWTACPDPETKKGASSASAFSTFVAIVVAVHSLF